jgi:hypothetical protein
LLAAGCGGGTDILHVFQGLHGPVEELRRDDDCTSTTSTAEDLNRCALRVVKHLALVRAKIAGSR